MQQIDLERSLKKSTVRFEMIASLLDDSLSIVEKRRIRTFILEKYEISERTLSRYIKKYREQGLKGLEPKIRKDTRKSKAIPKEALEAAMLYRKELPERSTRSLIIILEKEGIIKKGTVALSTLSRNLRELDHSTKQLRIATQTQAARRFVREGRNTLWQSDVKFGPSLPDEKGKKQKTYLISFIDDATRLICHSEFYFNHRVPMLEDCLRKALIAYGKPDRLFVDNGKEYVSKWMHYACAGLGIKLIRARPACPAAKGKIERFNGHVNQFLAEVKLKLPDSLEKLNQLYSAWLSEAYQNKPHDSLNEKTPLECYQADKKRVTFPSEKQCYEAFLHHEERRVDKTGCVSLCGTQYDVGTAYIGKRIELRFDPFNLSQIEIWANNEFKAYAKPLVIGEHTPPIIPKTDVQPIEVGESRLLKIYAADFEKKKIAATGLLTFGIDKKQAAEKKETAVGILNFGIAQVQKAEQKAEGEKNV